MGSEVDKMARLRIVYYTIFPIDYARLGIEKVISEKVTYAGDQLGDWLVDAIVEVPKEFTLRDLQELKERLYPVLESIEVIRE